MDDGDCETCEGLASMPRSSCSSNCGECGECWYDDDCEDCNGTGKGPMAMEDAKQLTGQAAMAELVAETERLGLYGRGKCHAQPWCDECNQAKCVCDVMESPPIKDKEGGRL